MVAAANNANVPPFITFVDVDSHKVLGQIVFDGNNNTPDATNTGIEQPQWSAKTGLIYVSVPQIVQGTDTVSMSRGGISVIDPHSMKVINTYEVDNCSPAGLTIGPNNQALIGCSASFGTPATTQTFVINLRTGELSAPIPIGGSDQVWFDRGTNHYYYLGARNNLAAASPIRSWARLMPTPTLSMAVRRHPPQPTRSRQTSSSTKSSCPSDLCRPTASPAPIRLTHARKMAASRSLCPRWPIDWQTAGRKLYDLTPSEGIFHAVRKAVGIGPS